MRWIREVDNELPETRLTAQAWDKLGLDNRHKAAVCVISVLYTTSCFRAAGGYRRSAAFDQMQVRRLTFLMAKPC